MIISALIESFRYELRLDDQPYRQGKLSPPAHDGLFRDGDKTPACRYDPMGQLALRNAQRARRLQRLGKDGARDQTRSAPASQLDRRRVAYASAPGAIRRPVEVALTGTPLPIRLVDLRAPHSHLALDNAVSLK